MYIDAGWTRLVIVALIADEVAPAVTVTTVAEAWPALPFHQTSVYVSPSLGLNSTVYAPAASAWNR